jgi:hypothetical protein
VTGAIAPVNARDFTGGASDFPVNARRVHFFLLPTARPARNVSSRRFDANERTIFHERARVWDSRKATESSTRFGVRV